VTAPLDLTDSYGEGWCVTLTRVEPDSALAVLGVDNPTDSPDGLEAAVARLASAVGFVDGQVMLFARRATSEWTLLVEFEGATGWAGLDPIGLGALSNGDVACSIRRDPNQCTATFAEDGEVTAGLDALTGLRWGAPGPGLAAALAEVGFVADRELADGIADWTSSQRAALVVLAATGVELRAELFAGPWRAGLTAPGG
jgi:hypothetical protein